MFGVALRRSACVKQQILPNQKTVALIFSDNQIRLRSNRKGDACCREGIDQTILGADCKDVKDASPEKNFPNFDCCAPLGVQPPNYDPYRIKVPDYAVPPLPPSSAKPMLHCASMKSHCCPAPECPPPPCCPPPKKPFPWLYVLVPLAMLGLAGLVWKCMCSKKKHKDHHRHGGAPRRKVRKPINPGDLPACVQYLIIGAGAAGWAGYRAIMENDKTAKVFMITQEDVYPYVRPPMSKHMWFNPEPPDIRYLNYVDNHKRQSMYLATCRDFMDPVKFYQKKTGPAVSIATGYCVVRLDPDDHVAYISTTCGEQAMYYERCLLAPGSRPKNLPFFKTAPKAVRDKVCLLRTVRDLEAAYGRVARAKHVTVIGGGVLGSELAYYLGRRNKMVEHEDDEAPLKITHVIKDKGIMGNTLPEYLGRWASELIRCQGVEVINKTQVYDGYLNEKGKLELTLSNGHSLETDYVFVCVGAEPRTSLAEAAMLELDHKNGGFLVNTEQEARKHLYVAGDAASVYYQMKDERMRLEHWACADDQGAIAGANMAGYWIPNNNEPGYRVRLMDDLEFEVVGEAGACMPTIGLYKPCAEDEHAESQEKGDGDALQCFEKGKEYKKLYQRGVLFYLRDETVVGVVYWNYAPDVPSREDRRGVATEIIRAKPSYKDINILAELLGFKDAKCVYLTETEKEEEKTEEVICLPYREITSSCPPPPCPLKPCDEVFKVHKCD